MGESEICSLLYNMSSTVPCVSHLSMQPFDLLGLTAETYWVAVRATASQNIWYLISRAFLKVALRLNKECSRCMDYCQLSSLFFTPPALRFGSLRLASFKYRVCHWSAADIQDITLLRRNTSFAVHREKELDVAFIAIQIVTESRWINTKSVFSEHAALRLLSEDSSRVDLELNWQKWFAR